MFLSNSLNIKEGANALRSNTHISMHSALEPLVDPFYTSLPVHLNFLDNSSGPQADTQNL